MRIGVLLLVLLTGCVGMVDDYSKTALMFGESASRNTAENLRAKHDLEFSAYLAAACGQPRIGALMRRYRDDELFEYVRFCRGFGR